MANLGYLQLTRDCYQHCRFCSNPPTGVDLSVSEMEGLIDGLADMDYDGVILTGGEPTMSPLLFPVDWWLCALSTRKNYCQYCAGLCGIRGLYL